MWICVDFCGFSVDFLWICCHLRMVPWTLPSCSMQSSWETSPRSRKMGPWHRMRSRVRHQVYPLGMTNSSPWYRWPIEIDDFPSYKPPFSSGMNTMAMLVITRWNVQFSIIWRPLWTMEGRWSAAKAQACQCEWLHDCVCVTWMKSATFGESRWWMTVKSQTLRTYTYCDFRFKS